MGDAYYQKGEYGKAIEAFEQAALKSKDIGLEADSRFNMGNSRFREAEQKKTNDLHKAFESYGKSVENYREALELSPDFIEAAENIEMARLEMQSVLDEMKKQGEISQKKNQEQGQTADQMQRLIEKQKQLKEMAEDIKNQVTQSADRQNSEKEMKGLAGDQKKLSTETKAFSDKLSGTHPDQSIKKYLSSASELQEKAALNLKNSQMGQAIENQEKSISELEKALYSLKNNDSNHPPQQQKPDQEDSGNISPDGEGPQKTKDEPGQEIREQGNDSSEEKDAAAILDEEKENIKNRKRESAIGYKEVERDW